jgi:hypothetical protein
VARRFDGLIELSLPIAIGREKRSPLEAPNAQHASSRQPRQKVSDHERRGGRKIE